MCNTDIREEMKSKGIRQWQIAEYLGIDESVFSRKMRHPLDVELKKDVVNAMDYLSKRKE